MASIRRSAGRRLRSLHSRLGTAGFTLAIVALVVALAGTAFAAKEVGLNKKQKKQVETIAKKFQGTGPQGPKGDTGSEGKAGSEGKPGKQGSSVVLVDEEPENCEAEEGLSYEIEGSGVLNEVCRGPEGAPWPAGGTLPLNATQTGSWSGITVEPEPGLGKGVSFVSFAIPLAAELAFPTKVHVIAEGGTPPAECENAGHVGSAGPSNPEAQSGHLCIYVAKAPEGGSVAPTKAGKPSGAELGASVSGSRLALTGTEIGQVFYGTFAVTG